MNSFKDKLDLKTIFIIILAIALILSFVFRPSKSIDKHEDEKKQLELENKKLMNHFDSISKVNILIEDYRKKIADSLIMVKIALNTSNNKIKELEKRRYENNKIVNNLNANGVVDEFTKYLSNK